jgi:hypothetical protein
MICEHEASEEQIHTEECCDHRDDHPFRDPLIVVDCVVIGNSARSTPAFRSRRLPLAALRELLVHATRSWTSRSTAREGTNAYHQSINQSWINQSWISHGSIRAFYSDPL